MKRFFVFALFACVFTILSACQTSELSNIPVVETITDETIAETTVKAPVRAIPVNPLDYISEQTLTTQVSPVGNLFANPGFEVASLDGWTACDKGGIKLSTDVYEGSGALEVIAGNCFYQSVSVNPDEELTLSCYVKILSGSAWTGMGVGFSDSDWKTLGDGSSTIITGNSYERYDVKITAPTSSNYASMWLYSDNNAVVDNCSLMSEQEPPPPPVTGNNLLENPDFNIRIPGAPFSPPLPEDWSTGCGGTFRLVNNGLPLGETKGVEISVSGCLDQSLSASDIAALKGQDFRYSCAVRNTGEYASMSIFLDGTPHSVVIPSTNAAGFETVEIKGTAGSDITSGFVSVYAEGSKLTVNECSLTVDGNQPQPAPEITLLNLGVDIVSPNDSTRISLKVENTGNVPFKQLNVSSEGNVLDCGFNFLDVAVEEFKLYICQLPEIAFGDTKTYTINAVATVETDGGPLTVTESYTITQTNLDETGNLLDNGDFASLDSNAKPNNWTKGCGGVWTSARGIDIYGLLLQDGVCVDQTLSSEDISKLAGKDYTYSCYIRKYDNRYASMSIFLDGQSESQVIPLNDDFQLLEIKSTAGQISSGFVSIYSEGAIVVDDCSLTVEDSGGVEPGTQLWFDRFGTEGIGESVYAIGLTPSGVYSSGTVTNADNTRDGFIRKYDHDGNVLFSQSVSNNRNTEESSIDADGNTYILQTTRTPIANGPYATLDAYILKYSPTGTLLFDTLVKSIDYYTGGSSGAAFYTDLIVTDTAIYLNGRNVGLNKLDLSGNIVWTSGASGTVIGGLAISPDESSVYLTTSGRGRTTPLLSQLNANDGTLVWEQLLPNGYSATDLVADNSHVYLMGSTVDTLTNQATDITDGYLWKYDSAGNQIWTSQYATNLNDVLTRAVLYNDALYVTGSIDKDGFLKKINTQTAAEEWSVNLDIESYDIYSDIAVDSTGVYVGGYLADLGVVGNSQFPTNSDGFVAKYSLP